MNNEADLLLAERLRRPWWTSDRQGLEHIAEALEAHGHHALRDLAEVVRRAVEREEAR